MASIDLQEVHDFLIKIAHEAGDMINTARPKAAGLGTKKNSADLVTETDQAVEKMVSTKLREKYPDFECAPHCLHGSACRLILADSWARRLISQAIP